MIKIKKRLLFILLLCSTGIDAATLFVTNLLDDGSPGTLRETIATASSGDTIQFNVSGTIFLDEIFGNLFFDKRLIIDGQNKIIIDGQNQLNIGLHIATPSANDSVIQNITIQNFSGNQVAPGSRIAPQSLSAVGVLLDQEAANCSVINTTIMNITSAGVDDSNFNYAAGILSDITPGFSEQFKEITGNKISNIRSGDNATGNTGFAVGIRADAITDKCHNNTITNVRSGNALGSTGSAVGVRAEELNNCTNNVINTVVSGNGDSSSSVTGIASSIVTGECSNNSISGLASGSATNNSGSVNGISAFPNSSLIGLFQANCNNNVITNLLSGAANNTGSVFGIAMKAALGTIILDGNCNNNTISNLSSGVSQSNSGFARGITIISITGSCNNNTVSNLIGGQAGNNSQAVTGILIQDTLSGDCSDNIILHLTSGNADNISGIVGGIFGDGTFAGNLSSNTIQHLTTGAGGTVDQHAIGVFVNRIDGNCLNNLVTDVSITDAITIERSGGIRFSFVNDGSLIACNTIRKITGGQNGLTFGMEVEEGTDLTLRNNTIDSVTDINGPAHGLILGNDGSEGKTVSTSLVSFNKISNISGNNLNGYGITIFGPQDQSIGNDLLKNSIFDINGKAINIVNNGVPIDATVRLQSAVCGANKIIIRGTLEPEIGFEESEFLVQFFVSSNNTPPQAMTFIGETTIQADDTTPFMTEIKTCNIDTSGFITATATALPEGSTENNNTSEVSNAISGCDSSTVCSLLCTPSSTPATCPIRS